MSIMPNPRHRRLAHFGSIYFAQGAILSYFLTFNILYLRQHGFAADQIGIFQASLVLPFLMKLLFALISDRYSLFGLGHRFPYIAVGLIVQCLALLMLPAGNLVLVLACLLFGFAYGYYTAVYSAAAMLSSDRRIAASMFAVFMIFLNIGVALGQAIGGAVTQATGFQGLAWLMALVSLVNLELVRRIRA